MKNIVLKRIGLVIGVVISILLAVGLYLNPYKVGRELGEYKGVQIRENGIVFYYSHGKNFATDNYYYGQKWQCTEFVKRFYHDVYNHKMPNVWGHAKDYFDNNVPQGELNTKRNMIQYKNGGIEAPKPDDLIVFTNTKYGHVAIISEIKDNNIKVVQQNILGKPSNLYHLKVENGKYYIDYPRVPAGWMRIRSCTYICHL